MYLITEGLTKHIPFTFSDVLGNPVKPIAAFYRIIDKLTGVEVRPNTQIMGLAASIHLYLTTADTVILSRANAWEGRVILLTFELEDGTTGTREEEYTVLQASTIVLPAARTYKVPQSGDPVNLRFLKKAHSVLDYGVDWSEWLEPDDLIDQSVWVVDTTSNLVINSQSKSRDKGLVWFSAGSKGIYTVENRIITVGGRVDMVQFQLQVA